MVDRLTRSKLFGLFLIPTIILIVTMGVFVQVVGFDFIAYDDPDYVTANPWVTRGMDPDTLAWAFTTFHAGNWHPITWISHILDYQMFGLQAGSHHLISALIHAINALLLFFVFRSLTTSSGLSGWVAILFAIHPIHVESVAWVSERKDVLSGLFFFLTIAMYHRYVRRPSVQTYLPIGICFTLGLMTKPMLVTLPFVLLLLDFWPLKRISDIRELKGMGSLITEKIPLLILTAISCVITIYAQQSWGAIQQVSQLPFQFRLANAVVAYVKYIAKLIWPTDLAVFYPHPGVPDLWETFISVIVLVTITAVAIRFRRSHPWILVGWCWFIGTLIPVIGLVQVGSQAMADRYTYIPAIGLFIATVWEVNHWLWKTRRWIVPTVLAGAIVVCSLSFSAWKQTRLWQNTISLFQHTLRVTSANSVAHNILANAFAKKGDHNSAIAHYLEAIRINPQYVDARLNLGLLLSKQGQLTNAKRQLEQVLAQDPKNFKAYLALGILSSRQGRPDEAIAHFRQALKLRPDSFKAHNNLGLALMEKGDVDGAIFHYQQALAIYPDDLAAHINLGSALRRKNQLDLAIGHYQKALDIDPNHFGAHVNIGVALEQKGNLTKAIAHYQTALNLNPESWIAHLNLGIALDKSGRPQKAVTHLRASHELNPDAPHAAYQLACLHSRMHQLKTAAHWLAEAIENGFQNKKELYAETDLANLRQSNFWNPLLAQLE